MAVTWTLNTERVLDWGTPEEYNDIRCKFIEAADEFTNKTHPEIPRWLVSHNTINFSGMPVVYDADRLDSVARMGMMGVYWMSLKYFNRGVFTLGQLIDIRDAMIILDQANVLKWPRVAKINLKNFIDDAVRQGGPVYASICAGPKTAVDPEAINRLKFLLDKNRNNK